MDSRVIKGLWRERGGFMILFLYYKILDWQISSRVDVAFDIFSWAQEEELLKQKGMKLSHLASRQ